MAATSDEVLERAVADASGGVIRGPPSSSGTRRRCTQVTSRMISSSTTAAAEARPVLLNWKASLIVWITKVSVPVAPPVMMNGISKADSEPEIDEDDASG